MKTSTTHFVRALGFGAIAMIAPLMTYAATVVQLATWGSSDHICNRQFIPVLGKALENDGPAQAVTLKVFPGGQLANDKDMPVAIPSGQVKTGWITVNGWSGTVRDTLLFDAPSGLTTDQFYKITDEHHGLMSLLNRDFQKKNAVLLGLASLGPPAIVSNTPLKSPADFKGKKVRVFSQGQAETLRALGATPVSIPFADVYSAMQYGTVDAAIVGFQGIGSQRLYEVSKDALIPAGFFGTTMMGWAGNKSWIDGLSKPVRKTVLKAFDVASHSNRKAIQDQISGLTKSYEKRGMTVTSLKPGTQAYRAWQTDTAPLLKKTLKKLSPKVRTLISNEIKSAKQVAVQ